MADILHDFPIAATPDAVFAAIATPVGLDGWWTAKAKGTPLAGAEYELWFGPEYDWRAIVVRCEPGATFELRMTVADDDWRGTTVGFDLEPDGKETRVHFRHHGWPAANEHYRVSTFCWAMYLRLLKGFVERGETVPYEERLEA